MLPFDAFEVAQVADFADTDGTTWPERTDGMEEGWVEDEAIGEPYYAVYAHRPEGHVEWVKDFPTREEATLFAERLAAGRPVEQF